jgi:hypothetical protein
MLPKTMNISATLKMAKFISRKSKKSTTKLNLNRSIRFPNAPPIIKASERLLIESLASFLVSVAKYMKSITEKMEVMIFKNSCMSVKMLKAAPVFSA